MTVDYNEYLSYLTPFASFFNQKKVYGNQKGGAFDAASIIALLLSLYAAYLAWDCSRFETPLMRFIYTAIAFFLGGLYLAYYFVYRVLMGNRCYF